MKIRCPFLALAGVGVLISLALLQIAAGAERKEQVTPDDPKAMEDAKKAKEALLTLLRENKAMFQGQPDPEKLKDIPIKRSDKRDPQSFRWSAFEINVRTRTYSATIGGKSWMQWYSGKFAVDKSGNWTAQKPTVTYFDKGVRNQMGPRKGEKSNY